MTQECQAHAVICGQGGVGKSSLARAVLYRPEVVRIFGHCRYFVDCDCSEEPSLPGLMKSLISSFGLAADEGKPDRDRILSALKDSEKRCLVILDNLGTTDWQSSPNISLMSPHVQKSFGNRSKLDWQ